VHDSSRVRRGQGRGDLGAHRDRLAPGQRETSIEDAAERAPFEEFHHHERAAVRPLAVVVDLNDVRVRNLCLRKGFRAQALAPPADQLDGDVTVEHFIEPAPHLGHPTLAEPLNQPVAHAPD
jgi:hypothetical protein